MADVWVMTAGLSGIMPIAEQGKTFRLSNILNLFQNLGGSKHSDADQNLRWLIDRKGLRSPPTSSTNDREGGNSAIPILYKIQNPGL